MKLNPLAKTAIGLTAAGAAYVLVQKKRHALSNESSTGAEIHGFVHNGYEAVRETFAENFRLRREIGAACCVYHKGEKVADGFYDECIRDEAKFSLGFMKPNRGFPFGSQSSFGFPGAGGSFGFADPDAEIGYGYIPNRKSVTMGGDPRDVALRRALYSATPVAQN